MDRKPFGVPITVFLDGPRTFHIVSSVSDASDFLFDNWSENDSEKWSAAMNICHLAADGMAADAAGMRVSAIVTL